MIVVSANRAPGVGLQPLEQESLASTKTDRDIASSTTLEVSAGVSYSTEILKYTIQQTRFLKLNDEKSLSRKRPCQILQLTIAGHANETVVIATVNLLNARLCNLPLCVDHDPLSVIDYHHRKQVNSHGSKLTDLTLSICDTGCLEVLHEAVASAAVGCYNLLSLGLPDEAWSASALPCVTNSAIPHCFNYACVNSRTLCLQCAPDYVPDVNYTMCLPEACPPISEDSGCAVSGTDLFCGLKTIYEGSLCGPQTVVSVCPLEDCRCGDMSSSDVHSLVGFTECLDCTILPSLTASPTAPASSTSHSPTPTVTSSPSLGKALLGSGSVRGRAMDEQGRPLAKIEIQLDPIDSGGRRRRGMYINEQSAGWQNDLDRERRALQVVFTDEDGFYVFRNVMPGTFVLIINPFVEVGGKMLFVAVPARQIVSIRQSTSSTTVPFVYGPLGSISGGVVDGMGSPIGGAILNLYQSGNATPYLTTATDVSTGMYGFNELPDNDYIITLVVDGVGDGDFRILQNTAGTDSETIPVILPTPDGLVAIAQQNFIMGHSGSIYGILRQEGTHAYITAATVSLETDTQTYSTTTSAEGSFAFTGVGLGPAVLILPISVTIGELVFPSHNRVSVIFDQGTPTMMFEVLYAPLTTPSESPSPSPSVHTSPSASSVSTTPSATTSASRSSSTTPGASFKYEPFAECVT